MEHGLSKYVFFEKFGDHDNWREIKRSEWITYQQAQQWLGSHFESFSGLGSSNCDCDACSGGWTTDCQGYKVTFCSWGGYPEGFDHV